ncbi:MAG: septum formation initiator family protein [Oscillospiraceae bacterium]|nr:septum formation initiator family protein [Oscillospiraceae bacterium]
MSDVSIRKRKRSAAKIVRAYNKKKRRSLSPFSVTVGTVVVFAVVLGCGIRVAKNEITVYQKKQELENIQQQIESLEADNAVYQSILNDEDERSYMERIAVERLGYAYPGERRFCDPNKNNG